MKRNTLKSITMLLGLVAPAIGCSDGANVNIGETQSVGGKLSDYAATWDGYAEAYTFQPSGSDKVHLVLDAQGNGTVRVGTDALLPAATDPNVGYPVGAITTKPDLNDGLQGGVLYPVYAARVEANRIQIGLKPNDIYASWCALQTSYHVLIGNGAQLDAAGNPIPDGPLVPQYIDTCIPGSGGGESNGQCAVHINAQDGSSTDQPIDCGKYYLCLLQVCACNDGSCTAAPAVASDAGPASYPTELDGALDATGKNLTGTLNVNGTRVTVHLQRQ
jgi:hypothetical protein